MEPERVFGIGASVYISSFCYSVFRLEPWSTCTFSCLYCYARWYRVEPYRLRPQLEVLRLFSKLAARLQRCSAPPPYFRLATLSEPLQEAERLNMIAYRLLSIALRRDVPVVLNTKNPGMLLEEPWYSLVCEAADKGLLLLQVSLAALDERLMVLEPRVPNPFERLEAVRRLARDGVPVIIRVQPLIPNLERSHQRVIVESGNYVDGFIGESIRGTKEDIELLEKLGFDKVSWEPYELHKVPGKRGLLHPTAEWRARIHSVLRGVADSVSKTYAVCKDGLTFHTLPGDCCLVYRRLWVALRPTIHEALQFYREENRWPSMEELCSYAQSLSENYVCGDSINKYPNPVRRVFRIHESRFKRVLQGFARGDPSYGRLLLSEVLQQD